MGTLGLESVLVGDVGHGVGLTVITGVRVRTLGDLGVGVLGVGALDGLVVSGLGGGDSVGGFIAAEKKYIIYPANIDTQSRGAQE